VRIEPRVPPSAPTATPSPRSSSPTIRSPASATPPTRREQVLPPSTPRGKLSPPHGLNRGENGTDYFWPTDRPKAYGRQKRIRSDSCRIRSRIRLVINGYGKGYGFTNIRPHPKIYHISRLYPDNIRQNIRQWVVEYVIGERK
jgi:hypothetical protein